MTENSLGRWPVSIELPVAWGDMDVLGHVNNSHYLRWFEDARIVYFERSGMWARLSAIGQGPILARQTIDYRQPVTYPDTIRVKTTITRFGNTSFSMAFQIFSAKLGLVAEGDAVGVLIDYKTGQKVVLDDAFKESIYALERSA